MRSGQLTLTAYVFLLVFLIFVLACVAWLAPFMNNIISTNSTYSTGTEKYGLWLLPAVLVGGAITMFFMPNSTVNRR